VDFGYGEAVFASTGLVLVTHAHVDHLGGIAHHVALRALRGLPPPRYCAPAAIVPRLERLLDAWRDLQEAPLPARCSGLEPGGEVRLRKDLVVRAFATQHRVPSLGYAFVALHKHLRPELRGLPGHALAALRGRGEVIEDTHEVVELVVAGDTCIDALLCELT
jgi:ribonuclease Z